MSRGGGSLPLIAPEATPGVVGMSPRASVSAGGLAALSDSSWVAPITAEAEKEKRLNRMVKVAQLGNDYAQLLDAERERLAGDPDYNTREPRFRAFATEQQKKIAEGLDKETADYFLAHSTQMAQAGDIAVRANARKDRRDDAIVTLGRTNNDLVVQAGNAPNDAARATIMGQITSNLDSALATNVLTAAEHKTLVNDTLKAADRAKALRDIRDNPYGTSQRLADPAFLPNLDPVLRENLINTANTEVRAREARAYTNMARAEIAERRATAKAGDEALKTISDLVDQGETQKAEDALAASRPMLKHQDYDAAKKMIRGGAQFDDRDAIGRIAPNIDVSDQTAELNRALKNGELTTPTYRALLERNRAALRDDQPASSYRQGRDFIKTILDPAAAGLGSGMFGGITAGLRGDALMEYDAWADANRDKIKENGQLALDYARDVGRRYRIVEFSETTQALGLPRFFAGNRNDFDETNLKEAARRTQQAYEKGEMSPAEWAGQARLLRSWAAAIGKKKLTEPTPQGGPQ